MLIPLRTDAPVYHTPWATFGIIAVNTAIQMWSSATDYEYSVGLMLHYGTIAPYQWLTSVFLHAGWGHLIGNMIFLWVFGLVVEGKVGWWRFLAIYAGIAMTSGMIEQLIMLGGHKGSLGASGVIFGLLAITMIWAPDNEIDCMLLLYGAQTVELSIKTFCGIYLLLQMWFASTSGFSMSSEVLHLLGAACGLPIGILMLKKGWVDCEGWDWFSRAARHRSPAKPATGDPRAAIPARDTAVDNAGRDAELIASFRELIAGGSSEPALRLWTTMGAGRARIPLTDRAALVCLLVDARQVEDAAPLLDSILAEDPGHPHVGLRKAELLIQQRRPAAALDVLNAIQGRVQPGQQAELAAQLRARASALQAEGVLELA